MLLCPNSRGFKFQGIIPPLSTSPRQKLSPFLSQGKGRSQAAPASSGVFPSNPAGNLSETSAKSSSFPVHSFQAKKTSNFWGNFCCWRSCSSWVWLGIPRQESSKTLQRLLEEGKAREERPGCKIPPQMDLPPPKVDFPPSRNFSPPRMDFLLPPWTFLQLRER